MADIPTPRSYNQILGEMIAAFLAKYPIENLKVGGPLLTMMEAAAQSDLRNTSDIFKFLASANSDTAEGDALTKALKDEGTDWLGSVAATGTVKIGDSRYTKLASVVYFGKPAPIIGSATLYVSDATGWPTSGRLYIGRDTGNYEGPLDYTNIVDNGSYFTITLDPGSTTNRFHNLGESVIVAQGGNRPISAGALVGLADGSITYSVKYATTLLDGETELDGVQVVCTQAGTVGNAPIGAINTWAAAPFTGATVENILPFNNGFDAESTEQAQTRLRKLRKSRAKGIDSAVEAYLAGVTSTEENKRITSAKVVRREGVPVTAYIDDGTGYEEQTAGVAYEVLTSSALGGEQYFQLSLGRPVAKAFLESSKSEPYNVPAGATLSVRVGGILSTVSFQNSDFRSPTNAEAYEIVHAINAQPLALFSARLSSGGTKVTLFAKGESNEDLQVVAPVGAIDANAVLGFSTGLTETVGIYKNDVLLAKDGRPAFIETNPQSAWQAMATGDDLTINVDGTGDVTYTFTDLDFVNANTGYLTLASTNSLVSWAKVLNYKIPGINATVIGNRIRIESNLGEDPRGSLAITGGALVTADMFGLSVSEARSRDYTLNRNTGQLKLTVPLVVGDRLTAGTPYTAAFLESDFIPATVGVTVTAGNMYFVVDGDTQYIRLPLQGTTTFTETAQGIALPPPGVADHLVLTSNEDVFEDVQIGDWIILTDTAFLNPGAFRVAHKPSNKIVWMAYGTVIPQGAPFSLDHQGLAVVRTTASVQTVSLATGVWTAEQLASAMNVLEGAHGEVVRTGHFRAIADTREGGDIMYVIGDYSVRDVPLPVGVLATAEINHNAFAEAGTPENAVPLMSNGVGSLTGVFSPTVFGTAPMAYASQGDILNALRALVYTAVDDGHGNVLGFSSTLESIVTGGSSVFTVRETPVSITGFLSMDRFYLSRPYCIGPFDDLSVVLDNDINLKRFEVGMGRKVDTSLGTYTHAGMTIRDGANGNNPFGAAFGSSFSFDDYALYMHPRAITNSGGVAETLWRWKEMGPGGENCIVQFEYPSAPLQTGAQFEVTYGESVSVPHRLKALLTSGGARVLPQTNATTKIGYRSRGAEGSLSKIYLYTAVNVRTWQVDAAGEVTLVLTAPEDTANLAFEHGFAVNNVIYLTITAGGVPIPDGQYSITGVTATSIKFQIGGPQPPAAGGNDVGVVMFDPVGTNLNWIGALADDVLYSDGVFGVANYDNKPLYIKGIVAGTSNRVLEVWVPTTGIASTNVLAWSANPIGTDLSVYGAGIIAHAAINANNDYPCTVVSIGGSDYTPAAIKASWVLEKTPSPVGNVFADGINYVKATTPAALPGNYSITLKNSVHASLLNNSEWVNEEVYLVPLTADCIRDYLNSTAVTGLGQSAEVRSTSGGSKIQIVTNTPGRTGKVEILGGLANSAMATVVGNGVVNSDGVGSHVIIPASELAGFQADWYVELFNTLPELKPATYSYNASLTSIAGNTFTFGADLGNYLIKSNINWQIERHGDYMAMVWNGQGTDPLSAAEAGDYIVVQQAGGDTISPANCGVFTILGHNTTQRLYYIYNPGGVEERVIATVVTANRNSVMPGDILQVGTSAWGAANERSFTVASVDYVTKRDFDTIETPAASGAVAPAQPGITLRAGSALSLIKRLDYITPYTDPDFKVLNFSVHKEKAATFSEVYDAKVRALSKLSFPSGMAEGRDGYEYNTGLIGEANRVLYGMETDYVTYPGVVASGANVNISGPVVRKIEIALSVRLRNGANKQATFDAIRTAITTFVNSLDIGTPVAISDIIDVANSIGGVEAVSISSPTYSTTSDQIAVQAYEKPMILQPDLDITLSLIA